MQNASNRYGNSIYNHPTIAQTAKEKARILTRASFLVRHAKPPVVADSHYPALTHFRQWTKRQTEDSTHHQNGWHLLLARSVENAIKSIQFTWKLPVDGHERATYVL